MDEATATVDEQNSNLPPDETTNDTSENQNSEESPMAEQNIPDNQAGSPNKAEDTDKGSEFKKPEIEGGGDASSKKKESRQPKKAQIGSGKSPAELAKDSSVPLPYKEPSWGKVPDADYGFDTLKGGIAMEPIKLSRGKQFLTVGRLAQCDIFLEHPSISRYHCILQYGVNPERKEGETGPESGWHLFDLGSTHGTWLNKQQAPAHKHIRLHVGHVLKFGWSTRFFILTGPEEDAEDESKKTVSQLIAERKSKEEAAEEPAPQSSQKTGKSGGGISWGMEQEVDDEDEKEGSEGEDIDFENLTAGEDYYRDDPVKALRHFFDRTGNEMEFEYVEKKTMKQRQWACRIELPVDNKSGHAVIAEVNTTGSKKEAQHQCALEACKILDRQGILRSGKGVESFKEKEKERMMENDFYESDEDIFLDRTGELERKRELRKRRLLEGSHENNKAKSYDELKSDLKEIEDEIVRLGEEVKKLEMKKKESVNKSSEDFTEQSAAETHDAKVKKSKLRLQIAELKLTASRLDKLCRVAKPTALPALKPAGMSNADVSKKAVWIGSMKGHRLRKAVTPAAPVLVKEEEQVGCEDGDMEEDEEDETEEEEKGPITVKETKLTDDKNDEITQIGISEQSASTPSAPTNSKSAISSKSTKPAETEKMDSSEVKIKSTDSRKRQKPDEALTAETDDRKDSETEKAPITPAHEPKAKPIEVRIENSGKSSAKKSRKGVVAEPNPFDPDYATWLPPADQAGDGKTALNAKYGY